MTPCKSKMTRGTSSKKGHDILTENLDSPLHVSCFAVSLAIHRRAPCLAVSLAVLRLTLCHCEPCHAPPCSCHASNLDMYRLYVSLTHLISKNLTSPCCALASPLRVLTSPCTCHRFYMSHQVSTTHIHTPQHICQALPQSFVSTKVIP